MSARWLLRLPTINQKRERINISKYSLELFQHYWEEFLCCSKKAKTIPSAGKIMATVFWDTRLIILIDFLKKGKMIARLYYASMLDHLNEEINKKWPYLTKKKVLFYQDNVAAHSSATDSKIFWITVWNSSTLLLLTRLSTFGLLSVS